jgi:hypothetical protein
MLPARRLEGYGVDEDASATRAALDVQAAKVDFDADGTLPSALSS